MKKTNNNRGGDLIFEVFSSLKMDKTITHGVSTSYL